MTETGRQRPLPPVRHRVVLASMTAAVRALGPLRHPIAAAGGRLAFTLDPTRAQRAANNHRRRDPLLTDEQARRLARESFAEYAKTSMDFIWANAMSPRRVERLSQVRGYEHLDAALRSGSGSVLTLTHFGNWDVAALIAQARGLPLTTVMAPIANPAVTAMVVHARERNALEVFPPDRAARNLLRALANGRHIALLADIPGGGPETVVDYCGGPVVFTLAPAWLALRTGAHLIPVSCRRGRRWEAPYVITIHERVEPNPGDDAAELMQRVARVLEADVAGDPRSWYPFAEVYADGRDSADPGSKD